MGHLAICMSSLENVYSDPLPIFFFFCIVLFAFLMLCCKSSLYILHIYLSLDLLFANIFS